MTGPQINPPKAPTDNLYLESFKTLSRLQLVSEFRPWLEYTRDYVFRRVDSPYFLFWDCILFGAPLNTLLELLGSHTPRHLVVTPDEFDFTIPAAERQPFFVSFIQRVQALELQRRIPFGEVLKLEDFMGSQNASFIRILRTIIRVIHAIQESYPGLYVTPHGSAARQESLIQQLTEAERAHTAALAKTADNCAKLYEDPSIAHPALEGFIVNCSRLIPYHQHVLQHLTKAYDSPTKEQWGFIFSLEDKNFFTRTCSAYRSICANYLGFHQFLKSVSLEPRRKEAAGSILRSISDILNRPRGYHATLNAILGVSCPTHQPAYNELCSAIVELKKLNDILDEVGLELRTMTAQRILSSRFYSAFDPFESDLGMALMDDYLLVDPITGVHYSVFLFDRMLICCADHYRRDSSHHTRYPIRPWEMGPALEQQFPLSVVLSIPTHSLKQLHCIDMAYFQLIWGSKSECNLTLYPASAHQYNQWVSLLEPFVTRMYHSTSVPTFPDDHAADEYPISLVSVDEQDKFGSIGRKSSLARPWSLLGRKGPNSESSSLIRVDISDAKSVLTPTMLPKLFINGNANGNGNGHAHANGNGHANGMKSPLHQHFVVDDAIPPMRLVDSPTEMEDGEQDGLKTVTQEKVFWSVPDLTGRVAREDHFAFAHGGYADVWRAAWEKEEGDKVKVAVKVLRINMDDEEAGAEERLVKRLYSELRIWKELCHPHVLELYGTVSDFGPHISLVCPWMKNGSITKYMERSGDLLSTQDRMQLISQAGDGLAYLHSRGVIHGDLTGSNILIDEKGKARVCDFGLSSLLIEECQDEGLSLSSLYGSQLRGSIRWADAHFFRSFDEDYAPTVGTQNDVYSFGSVMLEILSGRLPYHYIRTDNQVAMQLHQGIKPRRPASTFVDDNQWDLIQKCWSDPPESRPTMKDVLVELRRLSTPS